MSAQVRQCSPRGWGLNLIGPWGLVEWHLPWSNWIHTPQSLADVSSAGSLDLGSLPGILVREQRSQSTLSPSVVMPPVQIPDPLQRVTSFLQGEVSWAPFCFSNLDSPGITLSCLFQSHSARYALGHMAGACWDSTAVSAPISAFPWQHSHLEMAPAQL